LVAKIETWWSLSLRLRISLTLSPLLSTVARSASAIATVSPPANFTSQACNSSAGQSGPANLWYDRMAIRPHRDTRKKNPTRWGVVVETPTYHRTVFKVHYGKMTLKIYTKGERVLRIEVIVHNTKEYRWGRSLPCFGDIVVRLRDILERFLNAVGCLDAH
jgi:hypothetical protein